MRESMNIYAKEGDKVIFASMTAGYDGQAESASKVLELGKEYTIDHTDVFQSYTNVYLKEIPGRAFNSVLFDDAK